MGAILIECQVDNVGVSSFNLMNDATMTVVDVIE